MTSPARWAMAGGVAVGAVLGTLLALMSNDTATWAAKLHPGPRELVIREAANGYVVEAHVRNNPYPYTEAVFLTPDAVGAAVAGLLGERVPPPRWGK